MRRFAPALFSLAAACAPQPPLTKPGWTPAEYDADRLRCQSLMYYERGSRGRSAPDWNWFEQCMRARGYRR